MKFDEIQNEYKKDAILDKTRLVEESLNIPHIHNKYLKELYLAKDLFIRTELQYKRLKKEKWMYYTGKSDTSVYEKNPFNLKVLKGDLPLFMDADDELQDLVYKMSFIKQKIEFIDRVLKEINGRSFLINNVNKTLSFENGLN